MQTGDHQVLFYDYVPDILDRRGPHREAHLARLREWAADGRVVAAGALGDPPTGAAIVFRVDDPARIAEYMDGDPYVAAGLVTGHRIVPWALAITG
jgi:uncharacterized protein YciI